MIARSLMPAAMIFPMLNTILILVFAHFQTHDSSDSVAMLSINILTAITILWIGASKVQGFDLLRRKAEDDLRASAARMRLAQQVSRVGTFEWNIQTGVSVWTPELEVMYGLPPGGFAGTQRAWEELVHPDDQPEIARRVREAMASGDFEGEWRVTWPDGTVRWLIGRGSLVRDSTGTPLRMIGINMDVTDRKRAQDELRESNDRFRNMADHAPVMIWVAGTDKVLTFFNKTWLEFVGRTLEQELGNGWVESVHPDDRGRCFAAYSSAFEARQSFQIDCRLRRADGEYRWVLCSGVPRFAPGGVFAGYVGSDIDITDVKRAQEEAFQKQKLDSLGVLTAGIAHDFNNLLGSILVNAELAESDLADGSSPRDALQRIKAVAVRSSEIVRELMIYSGQDKADLQPVDLARLVEEMLELLRVSISKHAVLKADLPVDLPAVRGNAAQLRQIVMNLVINASEAIGDNSGEIEVTVSLARGGMNLPQADYLQLQVTDSGCGMTDEQKDRIFEPFFTSKFAGQGLGLAVVQGIVRAHGGGIEVLSQSGSGSTFRILLPCAGNRAEPQAATTLSASADPVFRSAPTVLLVEDEESLRCSVSAMLRKRGLSVVETGDGSTAVELCRHHQQRIDVILLDMTIPGCSSREVIAEARRCRPNAKVIVISAYSRETVMSSVEPELTNMFIRKPFSVTDLLEAVRTTLAS
jgi:PAS domain S-box-containing protein